MGAAGRAAAVGAGRRARTVIRGAAAMGALDGGMSPVTSVLLRSPAVAFMAGPSIDIARGVVC